MKNYEYRNQELHFGIKKMNLNNLVENYVHPVYVYDLDGIANRLKLWQKAFSSSVHYALKANHHELVLETILAAGAGLDVVSGGELLLGLDSGFLAEKIIFSGVAKSHYEIKLALESQIKQINVESTSELKRIAEIAKSLDVKAPVAIRFNPDVNPDTHPYITTGFKENKFGIEESSLNEVIEIFKDHPDDLEFKGLSTHIGSQITQIDVFIEALEKTVIVIENLKKQGLPSKTLDIGGGLGIFYDRDDLQEEENILTAYAQKVQPILSQLNLEILTEPGRWIVAHAGALIAKVEYVKKTPYKNFLILDTGMHHLIRPALYEAHHRIMPLKVKSKTACTYDVVGPICESSDVLGRSRDLPEMNEGDFVVIADSGAYGSVMSSDYNLHGRAFEVGV